MKIEKNLPLARNGSIERKSISGDNRFGALLARQLDGVREVAPATAREERDSSQSYGAEAWVLVEDAAALLDRALHQVEAGDSPEPELLLALQQVRDQLQSAGDESGTLESVKALIAIESRRLHTL